MHFNPTKALVAAVLAKVAAAQVDFCLGHICTLGTPTGAGPACVAKLWEESDPGCDLDGTAVEFGGPAGDFCDSLPVTTQICGKDVELVRTESGSVSTHVNCGINLIIDGVEYQGRETEGRECTGACTLANNFAGVHFGVLPFSC